MSQYATIDDLTRLGMPDTARGTLTDDQLNGALISASGEMDSYFGGRFALPLVAWDDTVREKCIHIAFYRAMKVRGYNPAAAGDTLIKQDFDDAIAWCRQVQKQQAHPNVTPQPSQNPTFAQPAVISSSVIDARGQTAPNRGW